MKRLKTYLLTITLLMIPSGTLAAETVVCMASGIVDTVWGDYKNFYSIENLAYLAGLSRINDDEHYFSQVALGWWIAYLAADSVDKTDKLKVNITPCLIQDGAGVLVTVRF